MKSKIVTLDDRLHELVSQLKTLSGNQVALYFAVCGERMLGLYKQFHKTESWGNPTVLNGIVDSIWNYFQRNEISDWHELLAQIEQVTPHSDDFDNISAAMAQDVCIVVDSAIRAINNDPIPQAVEYVFEPLRIMYSYENTGYLQLGSSSESERLERQLVQTPNVQQELYYQKKLFEQIERSSISDVSELEALRELGRQNPIRLNPN